MKTIKFLTLALSLCLFGACTPKNKGTADSQSITEDSTEAPGIGAAPDNSNEVPDSTIQQGDTSSVQKN